MVFPNKKGHNHVIFMSINFLHSCNFVWMELLLNQRPLPYNDKEGGHCYFCFAAWDPFKVDFSVSKTDQLSVRRMWQVLERQIK